MCQYLNNNYNNYNNNDKNRNANNNNNANSETSLIFKQILLFYRIESII